MSTLAWFLFWLAVAFILYVYVLFPAAVFIRGRLRPSHYKVADITPTVSLIIAARNEEEIIGAKLDNSLALEYPIENLEIIVASDGSTDRTNVIVTRYADSGVALIPLPPVGKAEALNTAVATAKSEILVFSDANSMYSPDAIRKLVRPFADQHVGGVAGNQRYFSTDADGLTSDGESRYWRFDQKLKMYESAAGSAVSATGAIYAIRQQFFQQVPEGVTDDFFISTGTIAQGFRLVFTADAIAYEPVAPSSSREFGRKVRVITRGFQSVWKRRNLLNPLRHGAYAIQLLSHKLMRRLVVFPLIVLLIATPLLWSTGLFYKLAFLGQFGFYLMAVLGFFTSGRGLRVSKIFSLPFYFCMVNLACLAATINVVRGHRIIHWEPQRENSGQLGYPQDQTASASERVRP